MKMPLIFIRLKYCLQPAMLIFIRGHGVAGGGKEFSGERLAGPSSSFPLLILLEDSLHAGLEINIALI